MQQTGRGTAQDSLCGVFAFEVTDMLCRFGNVLHLWGDAFEVLVDEGTTQQASGCFKQAKQTYPATDLPALAFHLGASNTDKYAFLCRLGASLRMAVTGTRTSHTTPVSRLVM